MARGVLRPEAKRFTVKPGRVCGIAPSGRATTRGKLATDCAGLGCGRSRGRQLAENAGLFGQHRSERSASGQTSISGLASAQIEQATRGQSHRWPNEIGNFFHVSVSLKMSFLAKCCKVFALQVRSFVGTADGSACEFWFFSILLQLMNRNRARTSYRAPTRYFPAIMTAVALGHSGRLSALRSSRYRPGT